LQDFVRDVDDLDFILFSFLLIISANASDSVRRVDDPAVSAYSADQDFHGLARYFFEQHNWEDEYYPEASMAGRMESAQSLEWSARVEETVLFYLASSRWDRLVSIGFDKMSHSERGQITQAQQLLNKYFPQLLGRQFPLDLEKTVFFRTRIFKSFCSVC